MASGPWGTAEETRAKKEVVTVLSCLQAGRLRDEPAENIKRYFAVLLVMV